MGALNDLAKEVHRNAVNHGWWESDRPFAEVLINIEGEVLELWEAYRRGTLDDQCDKPVPLTCKEEELADIIIRVLDLCGRQKVDIDKAVELKHAFNKTRPYKHGNKVA